MKLIEFGKIIPGLKINGKDAPYKVLNEREGRAAAGIMLAVAGVAFAQAFLLREFFIINLVVVVFLLEFGLRQVNPHIAPFYFLGGLMVRKQKVEWVGAAQKRFAWGLGFFMALSISILIYGFAIRGIVNLMFCLVCLALMWFESSFGICIGCKMYYGLMNIGLVKKPKILPACPGGVCQLGKK